MCVNRMKVVFSFSAEKRRQTEFALRLRFLHFWQRRLERTHDLKNQCIREHRT